jgi:hypothetical protein
VATASSRANVPAAISMYATARTPRRDHRERHRPGGPPRREKSVYGSSDTFTYRRSADSVPPSDPGPA